MVQTALNGDDAEFFRILWALRPDTFVEGDELYRSAALYTAAVPQPELRDAVTRWLRDNQARVDPDVLPPFARFLGRPLVCDQCAAPYQITHGVANHCDSDGLGLDHDADADHVPTGLALFFGPQED